MDDLTFSFTAASKSTFYAASSSPSYTPDPHAVSETEGMCYYAGLHSEPTLLYRTSKEPWSLPRGPWTRPLKKELREVFTHPITRVWNHELGWKVVEVMDAHTVRFTTIDVVRFEMVENQDVEGSLDEASRKALQAVGRVTIWIGVFPESTSPTAAHDAAQDVLALLKDYHITDVDIDFRESFYTREVGPQLLEPVWDLHPLVDVVSPITPALGLRISTKSTPNAQGTMALYLAEGGGSDRLLGLSCRHVLFGSKEANVDYVCHPSRPPKEVLLLGKGAFTNLVNSIKSKIGTHHSDIKFWRRQIEWFEEREKGTNIVDSEDARESRIHTQALVDEAEKAIPALVVFLDQVKKDWWKLYNRVLGYILRSPAIRLGVGQQHFTEDWGVFLVDRAKLGDGFQGNKMYLGTILRFCELERKCFARGADWKFEYPEDGLLPLVGTVTDDLMRDPDMWDSDGKPCLLVIKSGNATGLTIGRANGVFSIVRDYYHDMSIHQTSMEWAIINYGHGSDGFSEPGDSGAVIADVRGRIGGMLTGGSGKGESPDITYATPFWWLLERIKANGFPDAHPDVVV
ncbi:hypothetical protein BDZ89DRAFT_997164 [Hymenopellis radicata]|nr:hypothetical protein BDZ89DRAFT_997164 [Hymenopellis radicata]